MQTKLRDYDVCVLEWPMLEGTVSAETAKRLFGLKTAQEGHRYKVDVPTSCTEETPYSKAGGHREGRGGVYH